MLCAIFRSLLYFEVLSPFLPHGNPFLPSISEHFLTALHRGETIPRRAEEAMEKGSFNLYRWECVFIISKRVNLWKNLYREKQCVLWLPTAEGIGSHPAPTPVTQATVTGGTISIAEGQSGPEMPTQLLHCPVCLFPTIWAQDCSELNSACFRRRGSGPKGRRRSSYCCWIVLYWLYIKAIWQVLSCFRPTTAHAFHTLRRPGGIQDGNLLSILIRLYCYCPQSGLP